jgi:hypothetical protein
MDWLRQKMKGRGNPTDIKPKEARNMNNGLFEEEPSKYPIADLGDDFQVDAMSDFNARVKSGEFAELSEEEIREIYVQEEADAVERDEMADVHRQMDEDEERASNPDIDPDE